MQEMKQHGVCRTNMRCHHAEICSVKHQVSLPIVSWVEDPCHMAHSSHVSGSDYINNQGMSAFKSSKSNHLHDVHLADKLTQEFMELAKENTRNDLETCGILGASYRNGTYFVTTLIVPKQEMTAHSCQALSEEEIHATLAEQSLLPAGWIHTHPSQTCFLSSIDIHTQYSYQVMLPEAIAIVIAPTDPTRSCGIFRLTDPGGMAVLKKCDERGFHPHPEPADGRPLYEICSNVYFNPHLRFEIVDLRRSPSR